MKSESQKSGSLQDHLKDEVEEALETLWWELSDNPNRYAEGQKDVFLWLKEELERWEDR